MTPALEVLNLTKVYGKLRGPGLRAVDGVSLRVEPGTVFGLLGPNGAGKSTLVKMLLAVVRPTSGEARLFGRLAREAAARRRVGYLPEQMRLPDFLTAHKFLALMARLSGVPADLRRIDTLLDLVELDRFPRLRIREYSKGMQQRLGLAQALIHDPDLLFLDEPTEGLDPLGRKKFRDLLVVLKTGGKTVFLNSHLLSEVEQICDHIVILNRGKVVREGTVAEFTEIRGAWRLQVSAAGREAAAQLLGQVPGQDGFLVKAESAAELNRWIDRLREAGVEIEELQRERSSLEDFFIEVVNQ